MNKIMNKMILSILVLGLFFTLTIAHSEDNGIQVLTQKQDWSTMIVNQSDNKGIFSFTSSKGSGMMGVACEFDGQKYDNVHFFTPSFKPKIRVGKNGLKYVDIYLKAGPTEFNTSLLAGKASSGVHRLYYPTHLSNASIIKRLIEARDLVAQYKMANGQVTTEKFSLMGYTHNVTLNVQLCDELNRRVSINTMANTPENADTIGNSPNPSSPGSSDSSIGLGTCFAVSPNGHLVTNHHVIDGASDIAVRTSDGKIHEARVLTATSSTDLAILKIDDIKTSYLPISSSRSVSKGDEVFTIGYPLAFQLGTESKYTSGVISAKSGYGGEPIAYQITVPIQSGNSGGPLVNQSGEVVGVITSTAASLEFFKQSGNFPQNINWAVKSDYLTPLLDELHDGESANTRDEAIAAVEDSICMVVTKK